MANFTTILWTRTLNKRLDLVFDNIIKLSTLNFEFVK